MGNALNSVMVANHKLNFMKPRRLLALLSLVGMTEKFTTLAALPANASGGKGVMD